MTTTTMMSPSSNSNNSDSNKPLYSQRLVWMERSPHNWWPALTFANHGQALSELSHQLSHAVKARLSLTYISNPTQRVAQFVGTKELVELSSETRNFSDCIGQFYTAQRQDELAPAMDIIKQWLAQDVHNTGGQQGIPLEIGAEDAWSVVWQRLRQVGWKKKKTKSGNACWVFPGASRSIGLHGKDYFNTLQELQEYIRQEYNWNGSTSSAVVVQESTKNNKRSREPDGVKQTKRIWGRPKQQQATSAVVSTPQNQATRPQDPAKPLLSSSEEEEQDYTWKPLWDSLKKQGWTAIRAGKYNKLHDWYYVRPRASVDTGTMGVDYFQDPSDVIAFIRAQDEQDDDDFDGSKNNKEASMMPSPRKRSRKARVVQEDSTTTTSAPDKKTTASSKKSTVVATKKKPKQPMQTWWFHNEALPSFRQVWNILHTKLDFRYASGCYKLPFGDETFATDLDMRCHLLQHGIPNMDRLAPEDATILTRWVTFAHVPVKDTNSTVKLEDMQELTTKQALKLLQELKFVHNASDGSLRRGDNETFASLEEARVYIRASASLTPPIQGRRARGTKFEISLSPEQVLKLRVWAALSRTPLPTFPPSDDEHMEQEDATTPAVANGTSTSTTEKETEEIGAAVMEQEQDESAGNVVASKSNTNSLVFESDDDDDVPPSFSGLAMSSRVSMSPAFFDYQPLTQQE